MKLKKLEVTAFAGISPDSPVVLDFTQSKWINATADCGKGKTSLLNALLVACGQLSKDDKDLINIDSGKIDIDLEFVGKDKKLYNVHCTKSTFKLTYEGQALPEPISKMRELLGIVGVSPMEIKNAKLQEIIKWLSSYSNKSAEEFDKQIRKFKDGIKTAKENRATANRSLKSLNEYLNDEPMFNNWEESEAKYVKVTDIKELSAKLDTAGKNSDKLLQTETKLKQFEERRKKITEEIERLNKEAAEVDESISKGKDYIEKNKGAKKEYDEIKKQYDSAAQDVVDFNKWQEIKRKKAERDEFESFAQKYDATEKELLQGMKELQAEILPDIKGVDLVLEDTHEDGKLVKEGLYWNGKNVAQLSQSEWWSVVMAIWKKYKVKVVIIDNFGELGSLAVDMLEKLHNDGAYILTAEMNREQRTLEITYK